MQMAFQKRACRLAFRTPGGYNDAILTPPASDMPSSPARRIIILALFLAGLYCLYAAFVYSRQRDILFPAPRQAGGIASSPLPKDAERIVLELREGQTEAWLFGPNDPVTAPTPVLIFAHGNGELIEEWAPLFRTVRQRGLGVLLVEYPGYGYSSGAPSQESIAEAMIAAYDRLLTRDWVDPRRILGYGRSLGGGAILVLAQHRPLAALVLQSTFTSVRAFAGRFLVPGFLVRDPFDNISAIQAYRGPVLVLHGTSDPLIPFEHGQALAAALPSARLLGLDCGHNDCPPDWLQLWQEIFAFLQQSQVLDVSGR